MIINLGPATVHGATVNASIVVWFGDYTVFTSVNCEGTGKCTGTEVSYPVAQFDAGNVTIGELIFALMTFGHHTIAENTSVRPYEPVSAYMLQAVYSELAMIDVTAKAPAYVAHDVLWKLLNR